MTSSATQCVFSLKNKLRDLQLENENLKEQLKENTVISSMQVMKEMYEETEDALRQSVRRERETAEELEEMRRSAREVCEKNGMYARTLQTLGEILMLSYTRLGSGLDVLEDVSGSTLLADSLAAKVLVVKYEMTSMISYVNTARDLIGEHGESIALHTRRKI